MVLRLLLQEAFLLLDLQEQLLLEVGYLPLLELLLLLRVGHPLVHVPSGLQLNRLLVEQHGVDLLLVGSLQFTDPLRLRNLLPSLADQPGLGYLQLSLQVMNLLIALSLLNLHGSKCGLKLGLLLAELLLVQGVEVFVDLDHIGFERGGLGVERFHYGSLGLELLVLSDQDFL